MVYFLTYRCSGLDINQHNQHSHDCGDSTKRSLNDLTHTLKQHDMTRRQDYKQGVQAAKHGDTRSKNVGYIGDVFFHISDKTSAKKIVIGCSRSKRVKMQFSPAQTWNMWQTLYISILYSLISSCLMIAEDQVILRCPVLRELHFHGLDLLRLIKTALLQSHRIHVWYSIYANIWGILMVNVTIYGIHGSYGNYSKMHSRFKHKSCSASHLPLESTFHVSAVLTQLSKLKSNCL